MPLFKSSKPAPAPEPEPIAETTPDRKGSMFSRRSRSTDPKPVNNANAAASTNGTVAPSRSSSSSTHNFFGSNGSTNGDPTIQAARQKVSIAESAERDADRALNAARSAVRDARLHVKRLEEEAEEECV